METMNSYHNLRFAARRHWPQRLIPIGLALVLFTLLWRFMAHNILYWLLLLAVALLVWVASYGWRQALATLHNVIHRLEQL